jgi:glycosyltransferase involved in cell wall biosynthesis
MEETAPTAIQVEREPIRLALVITELEPGGAERCLVELATRIDRTRFAPVVYSLGPAPPQERHSLLDRLKESQIPVHFLDLRSAWEYFRGARHLAAMLREQRPEIVQTFLFHANVLGTRAARAAGVKHLVTNIRVADPRRWRSNLEQWTTSNADRIVCVSQGVKEFCQRSGFAAEKLVVIPNGIEVERWSSAAAADLRALGVPPGRRVFAFVGRLDKQKGLDRFFAELPRVFQQLHQHDFLVVGDGKLRSALENLAAQFGVADRVHFAGWQQNIPGVLAASDLLVLPSRWEGMPNVVLEAMAAGRPLVTTQAEGVLELLGNAAEAQSAEVDDWVGLRKKLIDILANPQKAKDLATRNQARAIDSFPLHSMIGHYERLYSQLLNHAGKKNL